MTAASQTMALPKITTDRPRQLPKSRFWPRLFSLVSLSSITLAPVAALSLWLLISDPVTAAAVMERGDLLPVLGALAKVLGKAFMSLLAAL
jgi:hypothetical protein